ncbi:hypothetical protein CCP3SC15_6740001 [Gammaproteobacteria bacterium]
MSHKFRFYERYGVEEYYVHDPERGKLNGWLRQVDRLEQLPSMEGWVSPRLGIRFHLEGIELVVYRPDGYRFETFLEQGRRATAEHQRAERLAERLRALGIDPNLEDP